MWWRAAGWTLVTSVKAVGRAGRAAVSGESPAELIEAARLELREAARALLGPDDEDLLAPGAPATNGRSEASAEVLRERTSALLETSADVDYEEEVHPAYARIVEELAPDEARILRLLAREGDQAAIDVKTSRPLGAGAETVAPGISMIGARYGDRIAAYLNNLFRLA